MIDSLLHIYKDLYYALPQSIKNALGGIYGAVPLSIRFGSLLRTQERIINEFEQLPESTQVDFIYQKALETIRFAEKYIPHYSKNFLQHGFSGNRFKDLADLTKVPLLSKEDLRKNLPDLYTGMVERPVKYFTGGTTSAPVELFLPLKTSRSKERAYINHILGKCGYRYRDHTLLLKGRMVGDRSGKTFWEYEPVERHLVVSSSHLSDRYAAPILEQVRKFRPRFIFGFPSAVVAYCKMVDSCASAIDHPPIEGVILASETVYDEQVSLLKERLRCPVVSHYGHTERSSIAYRIDLEPYRFLNCYGISRIVDGEIVSTSFDNFVMPFINYRTNDFCQEPFSLYQGTDICTSAGRIVGRLREYLVTDDRCLIPITTVLAGRFSSMEDIEDLQYHQREPGHATLRIKASDPGKVDRGRLAALMEEQTRGHIRFRVEIVKELKKSASGKRIMCVQELDVDSKR